MMVLKQAASLVASLAIVAAWAGITQAQGTISVNFSTNGRLGTATSDAPILATDVVGVVPVSNWNDGAGAGSSLSGLVDSTGAATTASGDWSTSASWGGNADPAPTDPTARMMTTWLDNGGPLTISNIPYAAYDVYIYGSSDGAGNVGRSLGWLVNGSTPVSQGTFQNVSGNDDFYGGTLVDGSTAADDPDYLKISGLVGNLSIADHPNDNGITRSAVSGIQIVEAANASSITLFVNRDTGNLSLNNNTGAAIDFAGLGILSGDGALVPANWTSINENYDTGTVGTDEWFEFVASSSELSEGTLGEGTLANGATLDLGNSWQKFINEDLTVEYLDANTDETIQGGVVFSGTTQTTPYVAGDYDFDGDIDEFDWPTQRDNYRADLSGATLAEGYLLGDFDLDGDSDLADTLAFKAAFLAQPGNSLASLTGAVPEPSSVLLLAMGQAFLGFSGVGQTPP